MPSAPPSNLRFCLITAVWGARFVDLFLRVTVRSLLAEGNVRPVAARHPTTFRIYTTREDAAAMRQSPLFKLLSEAVTVEIEMFADDIDRAKPTSHWHVWRPAVAAAKERGDTVILIVPDSLYPQGTLLHWASLFEQGYRAVWSAGPQVVQETALEDLERYVGTDGVLSISLADTHDLLIRHMHPLMIAMMRDAPRWIRHPEALFVAVPGHGLTMRISGSHPFSFDPNWFAMTDAFAPINHLDDIAFDGWRFISLEPLLKYGSHFYRPLRMGDTQLSVLGSWIDSFYGPGNMRASFASDRIVASGALDEAAFRRAEQASDIFLSQFRIVGALYRVVQTLLDAGATRAAQLLALAAIEGRLRRRWTFKGSVTIFAPTDAALKAWIRENRALLQPGNERAFFEALLLHVVDGAQSLRQGQTIDSARVIASPITVDDITIYLIDRVLDRLPVFQATSDQSATDRWQAHPSRLGRPEPTDVKSRLKRMVRTAAGPQGSVFTPATALRLAARLHQIVEGRIRRRLAARRQRKLPSPSIAELFAGIQAARLALNLREILLFYKERVACADAGTTTLALVEKLIAAHYVSESRIVTELKSLTTEHPDFADGWLELAYSAADASNYREALTYSDRGQLGTTAMPQQEGSIPVELASAAARADAHFKLGEYSAAADICRRALKDYRSGKLALLNARALRRLGRHEEALRYWPAALKFDVEVANVARLPDSLESFAAKLKSP